MSSSGYSSGIREDNRLTYGKVEEKEVSQLGYTRPGTSASGFGLTGYQGQTGNLQSGSYGSGLQQSGTSYGTGSPSGTSGLYQSGTYGTGTSGQSSTFQGGVFRGTSGTTQQPESGSSTQGGSRYTSSYGSTYKYEQSKDQPKK